MLAIINFINARQEEQEGEANAPTAGHFASPEVAPTDNLLALLAADIAAQPKRRK